MIVVRKSEERGAGHRDWLESRHTFSFGDYFDPKHMGFRALRVINEDRVAPGEGFPTHGHEDMEIFTWVLDGALEHRDSLGHGAILKPGEAQRMTAGTGIRHSEFNPSSSQPTHLLQIWILPERRGLNPGYEQKAFPAEGRRNRLQLLIASGAPDGALDIHQDARIFAARLEPRATVRHTLAPSRHVWLQATAGALVVDGLELKAGDGAAVSDASVVDIASPGGGEFLLFDLA